MEDNSSVKSLAERFQQKIFAQAPIDSLGLSPRGPVKRPQSAPEEEIRPNTTRERKDSREMISAPNVPARAITKGMQLPRKNSEPNVKVADKETNPNQLNKRHKIVSELLDTEQSYIKSLQFIFDKALTPLREDNKTNKENPILKLDDILSIFSNWEVILKCHITLGDTIAERLTTWDDNQKIGEIFLEETKFIKLYTYYVNNFDQARSVLTKCRDTNTRFREFIENLERDENSRGLSFDSYLIMPVQRIPRYVLLLQDLLNNTVKEHLDYENINGALGRVKDFANYINVSKRQTENLEKLRAIQEKLVSDADSIVKEGRKFVREGAVEVKDKKKNIKVQLYLLSDLLLITKAKKGKEVVIANLDLTACAVTDLSDDPPGFTIATPNGQWRVTFDDKKSSESWQSALNTQVKETIESLVGNSPKQEENIEELIADSEEQKQKHYLMRTKIVSELVEKDEEYVRTLKLITNFITRLKNSAGDGNKVITLDVILSIFSSWEMLSKCHDDLLAVLKDRLAHWQDKPLIGDVFIDKYTGFFKLYRHYVTNRQEQMEALEGALAAAPLFVIAITEIEAMEKKKIEKILEEPCRRLSSYYFTLQELLRNTSRDHPDYQNLIAAVKYVQEMDKSNNEADDYFPDSPSPTQSRPELKKKRSNSNFNGMLKRRNTQDKKDKK